MVRKRHGIASLLGNRNYRFLWTIGTINNSGELAEILAGSWLVYQLTGSPWQVALVGLSRTIAMCTLSLYAGALGDRLDKRHIMIGAHIVGTLAMGFVLLELTLGSIEPWHIFLASALKGGTRSFDNTSQRALLFQVVGPRRLVQAISLEHIGFSAGLIVGPLLVGTLIEITNNAIAVYAMLCAFYAFNGMCAYLLKVDGKSKSQPTRQIFQSIKEGMSHAYNSQAIRATLAATIIMNILFQYQLYIPVIAEEHLKVGPGLMGLLASADGIGKVSGSFIMGFLGSNIKRHGRIFWLGSFGLALSLLAFSISPWYILSFVTLLSLGLFQIGFSTMQSSIILIASPRELHSRISGTQQLAIGTGQLGVVEMGYLAQLFSVTGALSINALAVMLLLIAIWVFMPGLKQDLGSSN